MGADFGGGKGLGCALLTVMAASAAIGVFLYLLIKWFCSHITIAWI